MRTRTIQRRQQAESNRIAAIVGRSGNARSLLHELVDNVTLGRAAEATVTLEDDGVSRIHARVEVTPRGYELHDLGSKNGTQVNGERVEHATLSHGDVLAFGDTELEFRLLTPRELATTRRAAQAWQTLSPLSARELEVARLVASGCSNADVAKRLFISVKTVGTHLERVYQRLEIRSRTVLVRLVIEAGLIDGEQDDGDGAGRER